MPKSIQEHADEALHHAAEARKYARRARTCAIWAVLLSLTSALILILA